MSRPTSFVAFVAVTAFLLSSSALRANVLWSWSFSTESGTFITDGTQADLAASHTFHILSFNVTSSAYPNMAGATYFDINPVSGLLWNGSAVTQFFRSNGTLTNGSDFANSSNHWFYVLVPGTSLLDNSSEIDVTTGPLSVGPQRAITAIPTLDAAGLVFLAALLGAMGFAALLLRRT